ncbi:hypothetical protein QUC31_000034 [Theobroma cacao]
MLLYSFNHVMHGFIAKLTPSQVSKIKKSPAHLAIHEESFVKLLTTHFPKFLGLRHSSAFQANNSKEADNSPRDFLGHGRHTASIAAGNHVPGASQFGYAKGIARGMAPRAHLAIYKVANSEDIAESDVLAAMGQAIADGVDIMSLSLGFEQTPYFKDVIAIASLSASKKGIVVVCSSGNQEAYNSTRNAAPWITTVGAGTLDRSFSATVTLGNGLTFEGESTFPESVLISNASLYYGKGIIVADQIPFGALDDLSIPTLVLPTSSGALVREYAMGARIKAVVKTMRFVLTSLGTKPVPQVAVFSSRGPDPINPAILKPDVFAPGVDVLAAVPPFPKSRIGDYALVTDYAFKSGISMAAPHVAGVAAPLKAVHLEWSPAAIRSALMTTAYTINNNETTLTNQFYVSPATPLDYGAGHINRNKALDPGLIYNMVIQDYIHFLRGLGYNDTEMRAFQSSDDIPYPSFVAIFNDEASSPKVKNFSRVVTNVGDDQSIYQAVVRSSTAMTVRVEPNTLTFTKKYQKLSVMVSVEVDGPAPPWSYGYLKWTDQRNHTVSSPIVVLIS